MRADRQTDRNKDMRKLTGVFTTMRTRLKLALNNNIVRRNALKVA